MSEKRMAGDALKDPNFAARQKLSSDPEQAKARAAKVGSDYDVSGYSEKEISMALQGDSFGDEDYARLTGQSFSGGDDAPDSASPDVGQDPSPVAPIQPPATNEQDQWMTIPGGAAGADGASQTVQQDNDMVTNITGDGNTFSGKQDNSVGQFLGGYMRKHNFFK